MTNHETAVPTEIDRLHAEILEGRAQISELRGLLRSENQRANAAIDRETTAEQAAIEGEEQARRLGLMVDEYGAGASALTDKLWRVRDLHRKTCLVARSDVPPTSFTCGLCEVLDAPAAVSVPPPATRADDRAAAFREAAEGLLRLRDSLITEPDVTGKYLAGIERSAAELRRMAADAAVSGPCVVGEQQNETPEAEAHRCVCGDPVQLMDENDPASWIHSPGSDTRCLEARPRCPHCQMPHDLTPGSVPVAVCAATRHRIAEAERLHRQGDHSLCCRVDCDALRFHVRDEEIVIEFTVEEPQQ